MEAPKEVLYRFHKRTPRPTDPCNGFLLICLFLLVLCCLHFFTVDCNKLERGSTMLYAGVLSYLL